MIIQAIIYFTFIGRLYFLIDWKRMQILIFKIKSFDCVGEQIVFKSLTRANRKFLLTPDPLPALDGLTGSYQVVSLVTSNLAKEHIFILNIFIFYFSIGYDRPRAQVCPDKGYKENGQQGQVSPAHVSSFAFGLSGCLKATDLKKFSDQSSLCEDGMLPASKGRESGLRNEAMRTVIS